MSRSLLLAGCAGIITLIAIAEGGAQGPVTSAGLTVEQRAIRSDFAWIENRRAVPIVAWNVVSADGSRGTSGRGLIVPGATRRVWLGRAIGAAGRFRLGAIAYADGSIAGRREALGQLVETPPRTQATFEGVELRTQLGIAYDVVVAVENKRRVSIEAWSIDIYDDPTATSRDGSWTVDRCQSPPGDPGRGRIQPGGRREMSLARGGDRPLAVLPRVEVRAALWSDGHFEGDPSWREEVTAQRRQAAAEPDYWVPLLRQAAEMPGTNGMRFLQDKRAEWRKANPGARSITADNIEMWATLVSPEVQYRVLFTGAAAMLQRQREQCGM